MILITGGVGFIGANFAMHWSAATHEPLVNVDALTYAANPATLQALERLPAHHFVQGDIGNRALLDTILRQHRPRAVVNFAAETHVDRSILGPEIFVQTNVVGTQRLLESVRDYWNSLAQEEREQFRFLQVSTDEVYGSLNANQPAFTETSACQPNSPYSASKAAADHLVRAYGQTYGLPTIIARCSNNYGPYQFAEKLIPLMLRRALAGQSLPLYGDGLQVRDWLHVTDHCMALKTILQQGRVGEVYNVGGECELTNLQMVQHMCTLLDELRPQAGGAPYAEQIQFVPDRPGHDRRYAVDIGKMSHQLGWRPGVSLHKGLRQTVQWYLGNAAWADYIGQQTYHHWALPHGQSATG